MGVVWNPCLVYPSDSTGPYQDFEGKITKAIDLCDMGCVRVTIEVEGVGELSGYWHIPDSRRGDPTCVPPVGGKARIHVYNAGGGWYPDDEVVGWSGGPQ